MKRIMGAMCFALVSAFASGVHAQTILTFSHTDTPAGTRHKTAEFFAEKVKEYTEGRYEIQVYHSGQLANDPRAVEMLRVGGLDFTVTATGGYATVANGLNLTALPYLVDNYEHAWRLYENSEWLQEQFAELEKRNIKVLTTWEAGFRSFSTTFPMNSLEEIRGKKIRIFSSEMIRWIMEALGMSPIVMPVTDVYLGLQQGTVEGQENPIDTIYALRFYEVAKNITLTQHVYSPTPLGVSTLTWSRLSPEDREAVSRAAVEATQFSRDAVLAAEQVQLDAMEKGGATISRPDTGPFRDAVKSVYDLARGTYGDAVDRMLEEAQAVRANQ